MFNFTNKTTASALLGELERFLPYWLGPRQYAYGESLNELSEAALPEPLRRLYAFAGRWPSLSNKHQPHGVEIFSTQDSLLTLQQLKLTDDGKLEFIWENQGVWSLATLPEGDDPPVWADSEGLGIENSSQWTKISDSLTQLLITFCLQELTLGSKFSHSDERLVEYFRRGNAEIQPLWLDQTYVWSSSPLHSGRNDYSFYLMDGAVLVQESMDSLFFGANFEDGINLLKSL